MEHIEAKGLFNVKFLQLFMSKVSDTEEIGIISLPDTKMLTTKEHFFEKFWLINDVADEAEVILSTNNVYMTFTGADYKWWLKTDKRKTKLMSYNEVAVVSSSKVISNVIRNVAVAIQDENNLPIEVESITAPEVEVVAWLNNTITKKTIQHSYKCVILVCLNYHNNDEDKWHTFDEIVALNMILAK